MGYDAGVSVTTGVQNTLIGGSAGDSLTDADYNTAVGYDALAADTLGSKSTAMGRSALSSQNFTTATDAVNTAFGYFAGAAITTGERNVLIGGYAGQSATTPDDCVIIGYEAGGGATMTGHDNTFVGRRAGKATTSGNENACFGNKAGEALAGGADNTCLGSEAGNSLTSGSNCIFIGKSSRGPNDSSNQTVVGTDVVCVGDSNFTFGGGTTDSNVAFGATSITAPSDQRYKEDIATSTAGLSFIKDLRPVTFKWKKEKDLPSSHRSYVEGSESRTMNDYTNHGFIAQEVKAAIDAHSEIKDGFDMWATDNQPDGGRQRIGDASLMPMMVKAVQELSTALDAALARIATLEG